MPPEPTPTVGKKRIKFMQDVATKEAVPQTFEKDEVVELPEASANHWLNRQKAVETDEDVGKPHKAKAKAKAVAEDEGKKSPAHPQGGAGK